MVPTVGASSRFAKLVRTFSVVPVILCLAVGCTSTTVVSTRKGEQLRTERRNERHENAYKIVIVEEPTVDRPTLLLRLTRTAKSTREERAVYQEIEDVQITKHEWTPDFFLWPLYPVKVACGLTDLTAEITWPAVVYPLQWSAGGVATVWNSVYNIAPRAVVGATLAIGCMPVGLFVAASTADSNWILGTGVLVANLDLAVFGYLGESNEEEKVVASHDRGEASRWARWVGPGSGIIGRSIVPLSRALSVLPLGGAGSLLGREVPRLCGLTDFAKEVTDSTGPGAVYRPWLEFLSDSWDFTWKVGWILDAWKATIPPTWRWTWEPFALLPVAKQDSNDSRPTGREIEEKWSTVVLPVTTKPVAETQVTVSYSDSKELRAKTNWDGEVSVNLLKLVGSLKYGDEFSITITANTVPKPEIVTRRYRAKDLRKPRPPSLVLTKGPGIARRASYVVTGKATGDQELSSIAVELNGLKIAERGLEGGYVADMSEKMLLKKGTNRIKITVQDVGGKTAFQIIEVVFEPK